MRRHLWILALAILVPASQLSAAYYGTARVDMMGAYFNNTGNVTTSLGGPWLSPPYEATIVIDWDDTLYPLWSDSTLSNHPVFCIELQQTAADSNYFKVRDLEDAPLPGAGSPLSPMGATRATLLRKLWKQYADDALAGGPSTPNDPPATNPIASVAFAMCVWEIVFETATQGSSIDLDIDAGSFQLTGASISLSSVKTTAQGYLDSLASISGQGLPTLYAITHDTRQDQMFFFEGGPQEHGTHDEPIPEPGTIVQLLGLGVMGLLGYCRFRRPHP
jgi:hypothetical protein